jgi:TonB family protein
LGSNAEGAVFLTELHGPQSQKAAIKVIAAGDAHAALRLAGWEAAESLSHPHLLRLLRCGRCMVAKVEVIYAVSEYSEEILAEILLERPLTPAETRQMLDPLLDALSLLHKEGLVHGRLTPANILVVEDKLKISTDHVLAMGAAIAPPSEPCVYDAPETENNVLPASVDIWSLGMTLVEALTQQTPVWERSAPQEPLVPASVPPPFAAIAKECLRRNPQERCGIERVRELLDGKAAHTVRASMQTVEGKISAKGRGLALAACVILLAATGAVYLLRAHRAESAPQAIAQSTLPQETPVAASAPVTPAAESVVVKGEVVKRVMPVIPDEANSTIRGSFTVNIRVTVDASGNVSSAVADSPGPSKYFADLALKTARGWKFKPPQVDGKAAFSEWVLRFEFSPGATDVTPVEAHP